MNSVLHCDRFLRLTVQHDTLNQRSIIRGEPFQRFREQRREYLGTIRPGGARRNREVVWNGEIR